MARTRQPQTPTSIAPEWASRVLFAQVGGIPYDPISKILATVAGSPGVSASVGGRTHAYTSGVNNHSYQVPDAPFLGALSIFGIVTPASGAASTNYISKSAADNIQQPCYAGFESAYNGLYVVRSQSVSGFRSWRPTSASIAAGARATFAVIWATNRIETGPTFYVNATSSAATQVFSGGTTTGDVAGSGAPIKVGNRDSKDAVQIELIVVMSGALSAAEYLSLYGNPYQLFPPSRRVWVQLGPAAGGGAFELDAQPGGYSVSGTAATLARGLVVNAAPATYAVSGTAASVVRGYNLNAATGTFAATGVAAGLLRALSVNAGPGTFSLTGVVAGLDKTTAGAYTIDAQPGTYSLTGTAATLVYTPINAYTLDAQPGTYTLTGASAGLTYAGASIWTDVGVSAATWSDVGTSTSIWTDL
jgi:hypothetical protein